MNQQANTWTQDRDTLEWLLQHDYKKSKKGLLVLVFILYYTKKINQIN